MFDRLTPNAYAALSQSRREALLLGHDSIGEEHFLLGLLACPPNRAVAIIESLIGDPTRVRVAVEAMHDWRPPILDGGNVPFTAEARKALEACVSTAESLGDPWIGTEHVLLALASSSTSAVRSILESLGATHGAILAQLPSTEARRSTDEARVAEVALDRLVRARRRIDPEHARRVGRAHATLFLRGLHLNPTDVLALLPVEASEVEHARRGDPRRSADGRDDGTWNYGWMRFTTHGRILSKNINDHLDELVLYLSPVRDDLVKLQLDMPPRFDVLWESTDLQSCSGPWLDPDILRDIASLGGSVTFEIHSTEPDGDSRPGSHPSAT